MSLSPPYFLALLGTAVLALSGCSGLQGAGQGVVQALSPYSAEVVQGNFVSREQQQALKRGMSREQVREILGSPLITSVFHADRWDYVFTIRRQGQAPQRRSLSVFFSGDALSQVEHDALISEKEFVDSLSGQRAARKPIVLEATPEQLPAPAAPTPSTAPQSAPEPAAGRRYPPLEAPAR